MAKRKKTRQQKMIADKRRETLTTSLYSFSSESPKQQAKQLSIPVKQTAVVTSSSYQYLAKDLRKTVLFTGIVVVLELALRSFIK